MREMGRKVEEMESQGLDERLNDELNKLIGQKYRWERRILELGGPNYANVPNPSGRGPGYRYFGAAKKLPGVEELFEKPPQELLRKRRTRYDIDKKIDGSYYGSGDEEDEILAKVEGRAQQKMRVREVEEWERLDREVAKVEVREVEEQRKKSLGEIKMVSATEFVANSAALGLFLFPGDVMLPEELDAKFRELDEWRRLEERKMEARKRAALSEDVVEEKALLVHDVPLPGEKETLKKKKEAE